MATPPTPPPSVSAEGAHRRIDELSRRECVELLAAHRFGRIAVGSGIEAPVLRPVNYVFDEASQSIVIRTKADSKFHALARTAKAVFEIDEIDAETETGWSVIVSGITEEVTAPAELRRLDSLGLVTWAPGDRDRCVRIRAWTVSGRRITAE